ncbi:MAG: DivIVA domain-containing protein [candidate division NC10 bacterium]|nr:DivIVA domain-containing protein [candidate division NC10 bacterium]
MIRITPLDLLQHQFTRRLRGFDPEEVQGLLKETADQIEELVRENAALTERIKELSTEISQFQEREATLRNTLMTAQKVSEQIKESAQREAHLIAREAEIQAKKILEEAQARLRRVEMDIVELKRQRSNLRAKVQSILQAHQDLLSFDLEDEAGTAAEKREKK